MDQDTIIYKNNIVLKNNTDITTLNINNINTIDNVYVILEYLDKKKKYDLNKLVHNDNFEEFLAAVHIPKLARKAANAAKPIHKYTHIGDSFRVQIDGILKSDTTFTINGPSRTSKIRGLYFLDHLTYLEDKKGVMTRKIIQNDHKTNKRSPGDKSISEIVVTRALSKNGKRMVMKSTAIGCDGSEIAVAVQTFIKVA